MLAFAHPARSMANRFHDHSFLSEVLRHAERPGFDSGSATLFCTEVLNRRLQWRSRCVIVMFVTTISITLFSEL